MDHELLRCLKEKGYSDFECKQVVYGESIKEVRRNFGNGCVGFGPRRGACASVYGLGLGGADVSGSEGAGGAEQEQFRGGAAAVGRH